MEDSKIGEQRSNIEPTEEGLKVGEVVQANVVVGEDDRADLLRSGGSSFSVLWGGNKTGKNDNFFYLSYLNRLGWIGGRGVHRWRWKLLHHHNRPVLGHQPIAVLIGRLGLEQEGRSFGVRR